MEPTFYTGDTLIVQEQTDYTVNDIITFRAENDSPQTTTHRIVSTETSSDNHYYTTKGDNNNDIDLQKITKNQIVGTPVYTIKTLGSAVLFARSVAGIMLLIIVPVTALITLNLASLSNWVSEIYHKSNQRTL